ncbi:MAG: hypothetical protein ACI35S_00495 [Anaeroplasma sp.]
MTATEFWLITMIIVMGLVYCWTISEWISYVKSQKELYCSLQSRISDILNKLNEF